MVDQTPRTEIFDLNDVQEEPEQSPFESVQTEREESSSNVQSEEEESNSDIESEEQPPPPPQNFEEALVRINELEAEIKAQAEDHDRAISHEDTVD
jgi:hypothetical protein